MVISGDWAESFEERKRRWKRNRAPWWDTLASVIEANPWVLFPWCLAVFFLTLAAPNWIVR